MMMNSRLDRSSLDLDATKAAHLRVGLEYGGIHVNEEI